MISLLESIFYKDFLFSSIMAPVIMNNLKLLFISFISAFAAMFQFGYLGAVINPAQGSLTVFINNSNYDNRDEYLSSDKFNWVYSFIVNCYQIGFLIGTILTPLSVERFGRKWSLISTGAFDLVGSVVQVAAFIVEVRQNLSPFHLKFAITVYNHQTRIVGFVICRYTAV